MAQKRLQLFSQAAVSIQSKIDILSRPTSAMEISLKNAEISEALEKFRLDLDEAELEADSFASEEETGIAKEKLNLHRNILEELYLLWRRAIITSGKSKDELNREFIVGKYEEKTKEKLSNEEASQQFILGLTRTKILLQQQIEKSNAALEALEKSSSQIVGQYFDFSGLVKIGHRFLGNLKHRDFTDKLLLIIGLSFVILVAVSIVWSRISVWIPGGGIWKYLMKNEHSEL